MYRELMRHDDNAMIGIHGSILSDLAAQAERWRGAAIVLRAAMAAAGRYFKSMFEIHGYNRCD